MPQTDPAILELIRNSALQHGVDPSVLSRIAQVESGFNPQAAAGTSSARGLFQITGPTWKQYSQGGNPLDPAANADTAARLTAANVAALKAGGIEPSPGNLYLAHFAGAGGARQVLGADPSARVADVLGPQVVKANPFLANMTTADLSNWASRKMGGASSLPAQIATSGPTAAPVAQGGVPAIATDAEADPSMAALAALPKLAAANERPIEPQLQQINYAVSPGIQRARLLARAMAMRGANGGSA